MGAEFDGNFADVFDDLKSLVFDVDGAEADRLGLAQDAGDSERRATNSGLSLSNPQRRPRTPQPADVGKRILIPKADSFWTFLAEVACGGRVVSGSGRAPREEAAKIAILKSITLETLV